MKNAETSNVEQASVQSGTTPSVVSDTSAQAQPAQPKVEAQLAKE